MRLVEVEAGHVVTNLRLCRGPIQPDYFPQCDLSVPIEPEKLTHAHDASVLLC